MSAGNGSPPSTGPSSTASGPWLLSSREKSGASRAVSGSKIPTELLARAEARSGYVAVYVVGERGGDQIRIGTATNPTDVFKTAQQWNWREIDVHAVLWTPGKIWANRVKDAVERELTPFLIRGSWYELDPKMVINTIIACAQEVKADLFNDRQRISRFEDEIAKAMAKRQVLQRAHASPAEMISKPHGRGELVPFPGRKR